MPKKQKPDVLLDAFLDMLHDWDGQTPSFQEIVIDATVHAAYLRERNRDDTALAHDIAEMIGLPESYVRGWASGLQLPNQQLAKTFVNEIRIYLEQRRVPPSERAN